jgi:cysteinyl-tRNA synthetase
MNKDIFLTNSYGGKKEKFLPIDENNIKMYVCGPTVYDDPHIGNARPLVIFDLLFKVLKCKYGNDKVTYVRNITDIDDKIIQSAKDNKISIKDLTTKINNNFQEDCNYLICEKPSFQPKATENIKEMIEMISILVEKGFAYESKNHIYFEVNKFKDYGKLSNKKIDDLISGSRVEVSSNKKNAEDFVLWKPSNDDEPSWASPWGKGRPGWHLECSSMSKKYLGDKFDIHGGGRDLLFPHHENEIAQSCCANGTDVFSNYWVHNGFITQSNEKMSKSQGNILKISSFKENVNGQALRLALISTHYRQPLDWSDKLLEESKRTIDKWYNGYIELDKPKLISDDDLHPLYDDLNTPKYIANLHKLYEKSQSGNLEDKKVFVSACNFVGLLTETREEWNNFKKNKSPLSNELIEIKIKERNKARDNKNYELADKIRNELLEKGVQIEDKDGKTSWKFK